MGKSSSVTGAERLRAQIEAKGWTQLRLCEEIGATSSAVSRWLSGERIPERRHALAMERVLGLPISAWDVDEERRAKQSTRRAG